KKHGCGTHPSGPPKRRSPGPFRQNVFSPAKKKRTRACPTRESPSGRLALFSTSFLFGEAYVLAEWIDRQVRLVRGARSALHGLPPQEHPRTALGADPFDESIHFALQRPEQFGGALVVDLLPLLAGRGDDDFGADHVWGRRLDLPRVLGPRDARLAQQPGRRLYLGRRGGQLPLERQRVLVDGGEGHRGELQRVAAVARQPAELLRTVIGRRVAAADPVLDLDA